MVLAIPALSYTVFNHLTGNRLIKIYKGNRKVWKPLRNSEQSRDFQLKKYPKHFLWCGPKSPLIIKDGQDAHPTKLGNLFFGVPLENSTKKWTACSSASSLRDASRTLSNCILPVLVLLAGKMPALQEILGYFLNWKSLIIWFKQVRV